MISRLAGAGPAGQRACEDDRARVKAELCDEEPLPGLAASRSPAPQDFWPHQLSPHYS